MHVCGTALGRPGKTGPNWSRDERSTQEHMEDEGKLTLIPASLVAWDARHSLNNNTSPAHSTGSHPVLHMHGDLHHEAVVG